MIDFIQPSLYNQTDFTEKYSAIMKFEKNKVEPLHRWYPFVEGYSREFIESIINELDYRPQHCLDPFVGSGTSPVQLQNLGIKCSSFEVSPFMYLLAKTKLQNYTEYDGYVKSFNLIQKGLKINIKSDPVLKAPNSGTFVENDTLKKWIFDKSVMDGILDIKQSILTLDNQEHKNVFNVALASILLLVSNVYRNGKCVSYKKNWKNISISRNEVHNIFLQKVESIILPDINHLSQSKPVVSNYYGCHNEDVREGITKLRDNSIDLLITSPPYLNSRDYTDIYRIELWILDLIKSHEEIRTLRKQTLISHVQIKHGEIVAPYVSELEDCLKEINLHKDKFWNNEIPNMIKGYFRDLDYISRWLSRKMKKNSMAYINVANSSYFNVEVKVDEILADILEQNGFTIEEIRLARYLNPSSGKNNNANKLKETVLVVSS
ncbi:hypothetical protein C9994_07800 [Marivirga lumbricoides]|uniref:site-specific DNA-methyltransferase (cytosine-N(4)-specific) n=1 Tax=Marivirga lumbricoides TaxID=1046115 RepID=A0A2T4DRB1_9BACT|nr:hypothetical protein C9994_07800 [Marivirga lumbricoides]